MSERTIRWLAWCGFTAMGVVCGAFMDPGRLEWEGILIGLIAGGAVGWVLIRPTVD